MKLFRFASLFLAVFASVSARADLVDGVKAVVNDKVITYGEIQDFAGASIDALRRQYPSDSPEYRQKFNDVITNSLELLIERQLILHDFEARGYRMPESYLDQLVDDRTRERFGDRMTLMKTLQGQGITSEQFRKSVQEQTIETFMRSKNVSQEIVVSPFQVEQYYAAHQADYKVEDQVKLRMIVLNKTDFDDTNAPAQARDVLEKIKGGASFAEMARQFSQGSQASRGGDMDWVERSALRKELSDVAFSLKPGATSEVIETPESCYLLQVEEAKPAHVRPITEIREDIEKNLRAQKHQQLERQWIESLKKKTFIQIFA
jgi:peptidyl-prolyl cis-trans isomerase SurA